MKKRPNIQVVVLRKFGGPDDTELIPGQLVETGDWPPERLQRMIDQRLIRLATKDEIESAIEVPVDDVAVPTPKKKAPRCIWVLGVLMVCVPVMKAILKAPR